MKLTIGIPVYNGEKFIEQTINSVLNASFNWNDVEIIVSDNNSSDATCEIVNKYPQIKLFTHSENKGYDYNVDRLFHYAKGNYVWILGADDVLTTTDLSEIIELVSSAVPVYSVIFVGESNSVYAGQPLDANGFLIHTNFRSGFVSNNIINRKMWLSTNTAPFIGSNWIHYAMVFMLIKKSSPVFTKNNYVCEIPESKNKTWTKNGKMLSIGLDLVGIIQLMPLWGYDKSIVRRTKLIIKGAYPKVIIISKVHGFRCDWKTLRRFINMYMEYPSFWLVDIWAVLIPGIIYKGCYSIFNLFKFRS